MTTVKAAQRTVNWPSRRAGRRQSGFLLWGMAWNGSVHISRQWLAYFQKNTLHSLSLYPGSLYLPSPPWWSEQANKSSKVNINVCSQRSLDRSYRIADLCTAGGRSWPSGRSSVGRRTAWLFSLCVVSVSSSLPSYSHLLLLQAHIWLFFNISLAVLLPILRHPSLSRAGLPLARCFRDTGLSKWKAGLSLDIMANIRPLEWHKVREAKENQLECYVSSLSFCPTSSTVYPFLIILEEGRKQKCSEPERKEGDEGRWDFE